MLDPGYVSFFPPNVREVEDSDKNGVQNPSKKTAAVYLPAKTRQSSRIQDKGEMALKKAMDGKAKTKGALWSIWKTRNELVFDKKVVSSPSTLIYKALLLAKSWRPLLKPKMMPMADGMLNNISSRVASM